MARTPPEALVANVLGEAPDWSAHAAQLRGAALEGNASWLGAVARAFLGARSDAADHAAAGVLDALALVPGERAVDTVLELRSEPGTWRTWGARAHVDGRARTLGARLGQAQSVATLARAYRMLGSEATRGGRVTSLLACWTQEAVLRGKPVAIDATISAAWANLGAAGLELAQLPVELEALEERQLELAARYGVQSASGWAGRAPRPSTARGATASLATAELDDPARRARIAAFASSARAVSNGRVEARVIDLDPPLDARDVDASVVRALPLAALGGGDDEEEEEDELAPRPAPPARRERAAVGLAAIEPRQAFEALMAAAAIGGVYNVAWSGAHARGPARVSLGGLVGCPAGAPWGEVVERARRSTLWVVALDTPWFDSDGEEVALLALEPGGGRLAFVAYTDSA